MMDNNRKGTVCPLLQDPNSYRPDTVDLSKNCKEREYWLPTLEQMVKKVITKAKILNPDNPKATEKAELCFQQFHTLMGDLKEDPSILKTLSVRTILEFNEANLRAHGFKDFWLLQKEKESQLALEEFRTRIEQIDAMVNLNEKWLELAKGVLAGNVFDWGARAVTDILEMKADFSLSHAMSTIEDRPWFRDNLDEWIRRVQQKAYNTAVIFVDNAGFDFILGILPFARELLIQGTTVILVGNSLPALNDVTFRELGVYTCRAAEHCNILAKALINKQLLFAENGQKSPCLDLNNLTTELCDLMSSADLIMLEGMGRAVHTNLYVKFKVDSLKVAVLKNEWLAKSMGAKNFSVIFDFAAAT